MPERRRVKNLKSAIHATKRASGKAKKPAAAKKPLATKKPVKPAKVQAATKKAETVKSGSVSVCDLKGKSLQTITLDPLFHGSTVHPTIIYQAVRHYQALDREGTACTKDRGAVRGGGRKPWRQKGTGQARHGSRRSPIWRGGGATFGPKTRDFSYTMSEDVRRRAVAESIKDKAHSQKLMLIRNLEIEGAKTKFVSAILDSLKLEKPLFLVEKKNEQFVKASRNIPQVGIKTASEVNALDILTHRECVMTEGAYEGLLKRLKS